LTKLSLENVKNIEGYFFLLRRRPSPFVNPKSGGITLSTNETRLFDDSVRERFHIRPCAYPLRERKKAEDRQSQRARTHARPK